jgi:hypothetical protein
LEFSEYWQQLKDTAKEKVCELHGLQDLPLIMLSSHDRNTSRCQMPPRMQKKWFVKFGWLHPISLILMLLGRPLLVPSLCDVNAMHVFYGFMAILMD